MLQSAHEQDHYQPPAECIRAARAHIAEVMRSLKALSSDAAERSADLLSEAATQLQDAAAMLRGMECPGDANLRLEVERLRQELKTLSYALSQTDRLVSGWMRRMGSGYTERGGAAPLMLVKKVNITG